MSSLCQICSKELSKYRCPSCKISSCSSQCSQAHKSKCTQKQGVAGLPIDVARQKGSVESDTQDPPRVPSESLIADHEVQQLFQRHPGLQLQLQQIYQSTLEWEHVDRLNEARRRASSYRGRERGGHIYDRNKVGRWTPERGFVRGLEHLQTQQQSDSPTADGLKELSALILGRCSTEPR